MLNISNQTNALFGCSIPPAREEPDCLPVCQACILSLQEEWWINFLTNFGIRQKELDESEGRSELD